MNFLLLNTRDRKQGGESSADILQAELEKYGRVTSTGDWFSLLNYLHVEEYSAVFLCTESLKGNYDSWSREIQRLKSFQLFILCVGGPSLELELVSSVDQIFTVLHLDETEDELDGIIEHAREFRQLRQDLASKLPRAYLRPSGFGNFVGNSVSILNVYRQLVRVAGSDYTVLIRGESGSGKDLAARTLHDLSGRRKHPYISLNCAAIPENLLESELFGYEKGAFTGATQNKAGKFELADNGTIFLDEIGDLPVTLQAKLLRVLEDNAIQPLGSVQEKQVDFRLLTATHQDLPDLIRKKRFREDLHYRLNVISIQLPPIAEREADIYLLILHLLNKLLADDRSDLRFIEWALLKRLRAEDIGGNVRELENLMTRLVFQCEGDTLSMSCLQNVLDQRRPVNLEAESAPDSPQEVEEEIRPLKEIERDAIANALVKLEGNISRTAAQLGISRTALYRKISNYELEEYLVNTPRRSGDPDA